MEMHFGCKKVKLPVIILKNSIEIRYLNAIS